MFALNKKARSLIIRSVLLFAAAGLLFLLWSGEVSKVRAEGQAAAPERINIIPENFETGDDSSWLNPGNALTNDLSESAESLEFGKENSAALVLGLEEAVPSAGEAVPPSASGNETPEPAIMPADASSAGEVVPTTETNQSEPSSDTGQEPAVVPATPTESSGPPADVGDQAAPAIDLPSARSEHGHWQKIWQTLGVRNIGNSLSTLISIHPVSAEEPVIGSELPAEEPPSESLIVPSRSIVFKDFSAPAGFEDNQITNAQLRLSLAALSRIRGDKIKIEYGLDDVWHEAGTLDIDKEVSNKSNNGYQLYAMPIFNSWAELKGLEVRFSYFSEAAAEDLSRVTIYLDAIWLEVDYAKPLSDEELRLRADMQAEELRAAEAAVNAEKLKLRKAALDYELDLISTRSDFKPADQPEFIFSYKRKKSLVNKLLSTIASPFWDEYKNLGLQAEVKDDQGRARKIQTEVEYLADGRFKVRLGAMPRTLRPGKHSLQIRINDGDNEYLEVQDFSWGVLAINFNKSVYWPAETAYLQMAVLDDAGNTLCDAELFLEITAPDGGVANLNGYNGLIRSNPECGPNNVIDKPDYSAHYGLAGEGVYQVRLTAKTANGVKEITDQFEVRTQAVFEVERTGPTRIYPLANYKMRLAIKANTNFHQEIVETVPAGFTIISQRVKQNGLDLIQGSDYRFKISNGGAETNELAWSGLKIKQGQLVELEYEFDAPDVSPEFYLLGPLSLGDFKELRSWQIASDAVATADANAGWSRNWGTAANGYDRVDGTYATRVLPNNSQNDSANYLIATANNASTTLGGTITKVEIGVTGYVQTAANVTTYLVPVLNGTATGSAQTISGATMGNAPNNYTFHYVDITSASSSWNWANIANLDVMVYGNNNRAQTRTLYIDQIRIQVTYTPANTPPTGSINLITQATDGSGDVHVSINAYDAWGDLVRAKMEYVQGEACDFTSPLDPTFYTDAARITSAFATTTIDNQAPYQVGTSTTMIFTASGTNQITFDWNSKTDIPTADGTYCLRLTVNDQLIDQDTPATATTTIDNVSPSAPSILSVATSTLGNAVVVSFGASASDSNFSDYKIYYKAGASGVTEADSAWTVANDTNLGAADFYSATSTLIADLIPRTQYVFSLWAYDQFGNKASSSEVTVTTDKAAPTRANSVSFLAGNYSSANGTIGQLSDTDQTFAAFEFSLAETGAKIRNAYVLLDINYGAYVNTAVNYTGYHIAFDACTQPCTPNAFAGTGKIETDDSTILSYDETAGNVVKLLLDVTGEPQLSDYSGNGQALAGQVGYRIERGTATNSIAVARSQLVVTYQYGENDTENYTNTVVYPLESTVAGDSGARRAVQADDCTVDSNCPLFNYKMDVPEYKSSLSQWFQTYNQIDGNAVYDANIDVNIQGTNISSQVLIHESALGGTQGNGGVMYFDSVSGYQRNATQTLEYHGSSPGATLTYYLIGGEVVETYVASTTAAVKTRTVAYPLGEINNGLTNAKTNRVINVYLPENGVSTGAVVIKKAWVRLLTNNYNTSANTITVSTKVGSNAETAGYIYNYNAAGTVIKPAFNLIHIIPAVDYPELAAANATSSKAVTIYTTNSNNVSQGGMSAELMITYAYTSEVNGHLTSLNLFGGQSALNADAKLATATNIRMVSPEAAGTKTILAGSLLANYLISSSDGSVPGANLLLGANLGTTTPSCTNNFNSRPDSVNSFSDYYKDIVSVLAPINNQSYTACYSTNGAGDAFTGAKMSGVLLYTYKWEAPEARFSQRDWRWYNNSNSLVPGSSKAGEQVPISNVNRADVLRLRLNIGSLAENLSTSTQSFKLQFATSSNCSVVSSWTDVGTSTSNAMWRGYDNSSVGDASTTGTAMLFLSTKFESYEEENPSLTNPLPIHETEYGEWDWLVYNYNASSSTNYCFRMAKADGTAIYDYASYPQLYTAASNTPPQIPSDLWQGLDNGTTTIANGAWINQANVRLAAETFDVNINEGLRLFYQVVTNGSSFLTATTVPASPCVFGTAYGSCASKVWYATSTLGDYRVSAFRATTSITALPQDYSGYKWQVLGCDASNECLDWAVPGANPNFRLDLTVPGRPGNLTFDSKSVTSITLNFGASSTEANFDRYRLFYKKAASGVKETDTQFFDGSYLLQDYGGAATTTIIGLTAGTQYVFNLWAYDLAGNSTSSLLEFSTTTGSSFTPPTVSFQTISQKNDGSGAVDVAILVDDADNDDTLRAKFEYQQGVSCASPSKATIDENPANASATYGDPIVDNRLNYQVGSSTGWILTSPGANFTFFDWLSKTDAPNQNTTYCLKVTVNDGLFDSVSATTLFLVDNFPPSAPGSLTLNKKNSRSLTLNYGGQSTDANFDRYRIFYSTSSPVTATGTPHLDPNLLIDTYNSVPTTSITGLLPDTLYYINIWAYDDFGNVSSATQIATSTNALPNTPAINGQYRSNDAEIANGGWTTENQLKLSASVNDVNVSEQLSLYFELVGSSTAFKTATSVPASACVSGTTYTGCSGKIWYVPSALGNYSATPFSATTTITGLPESSTGYKWQVMACDDDGDCSGWVAYNLSSPNFKVDTIYPAWSPPSAGDLSLSSKTSVSVALNFGTSVTEANFSQYKIFYSTSSPVTVASGTEHIDVNLNSQTYGGASITTIENLSPNTQYFFNIWAFDQAGLATSSAEIAITTNPMQSTPGVTFYTKNTRVLYYKIWTGTAWSAERTGPTLGSAIGDNIRHLDSLRSDDGGKVAVLAKTWDGTNQEWWATVYRAAADNFANTTQLGGALAAATTNNLITGCIGSLSGGEFFIVRNNNGANGTLVYSWDALGGWASEAAGPNPVAVVNGCRLIRRPTTDNYLLVTFDNGLDIGTAYYTGTSTYSNSWTNWTEHSTNEDNLNNYVGEGFFDPGDNTRGAFNYSNSATNNFTYAKYFIADGADINYGAASTTPSGAPDSWSDDFVSGEFSADPGSIGLAYFAGADIGDQLNVYRLDISGSSPVWSTVANGDNISASALASSSKFIQRPYDIEFYKYYNGLVVWNNNISATPKFRKIDVVSNSVDASNTAVPGAAAAVYTRTKLYNDPNEIELMALYQNSAVDYNAIFWNGGSNAFYNSGNQAWYTIAAATGGGQYDEAVTYSYTSGNSAPNTSTNLTQQRADAFTSIVNGDWTNQSTVYLGASATDPDTSEVVTLYVQLLDNASTFNASTTQPTGACIWGTSYSACASKVWFVASSSAGDYSVVPFTNKVSITGVPDSAAGYKWQVISCDDSAACSNWVRFNAAQPNFMVDTLAPSLPGNLSIVSRNSNSVTLGFGASSTESNFQEYRIYYKAAAAGATLNDTRHNDANLSFINYNGKSTTTVISLASTTQYVFRIWAFDQAGSYATSSGEVSTTTAVGPVLAQTSYVFENDDGANVNSNSTSTSASTTLTNVYIGERLNARIQIENRGGDIASNKDYVLQYQNLTDAGAWTAITNSSEISYGLGLSGSDGDPITSRKANANANAWTNGQWREGTATANNYSLSASSYTELVFALRTHNALAGKTYRLRLYNNTDSKVLEVYNNYPALSTVATDNTRYSKGTYASAPTGSGDLSFYLDHRGYGDIAADDNVNRDPLSSSANFPVANFIRKNSTSSQAITATWNGQSTVAASTANIFLQVYRFGTTNAWVTVASNATATANTDLSITGNVNSNLSEYYDGNYWTYWRVYQASGSQTLRSDHYNVSFTPPVPEVKQIHYRWRTDDGSQTTAHWLEAEDAGSPTASTSLVKGKPIRLRLEVVNVGAGSSNYRYQIQYATTTSNCASDPGGWSAIPTDNSRAFRMSTTTNVTNYASTTAQMANSEGYTFAAGWTIKDPANTTGSTTLIEKRYTENEYAFLATPNAGDGVTYCFRVTNNGTALNSYDRLAELTTAGNPNSKPTFDIHPSDNGSATTTPTNSGSAVIFDATASDAELDDYYLAICKTNSVTAGNDGPPVCGGGNWCISNLASSSVMTTCSYIAATSSESLDWYAFACDKRAGTGVGKCSDMSQGTWGDSYDSPFAINHLPTFTSITTTVNNRAPGGTFVISTVSADTDILGTPDTLNFYVCRTNNATFGGCIDGTVCQATATSSPNASCSYTDTAPTPSGVNVYYGFLFDSHNTAAAANSRSGSYTVLNVAPVLGSLVLNGGSQINLNIRGAGDTAVSTVNTSVTDQNGCATGLVSATAQIYMSNATGGYSCAANNSDCYQVGLASCLKSDCVDDNDPVASYTCTANMKYYAVPTKNDSAGNPWEPYVWMSRMVVNDGSNLASTTSSGVELATNQALDVSELVIDYGNTLLVGQNSGVVNQPSTIINAGNSPINNRLYGTDMSGNPSGTLTVDNQEWSLTNGFNWSTGNDLTTSAVDVTTSIPRATSTVDTSRRIYWGIGIPLGTYPAAYSGQNIFDVVLDPTNW